MKQIIIVAISIISVSCSSMCKRPLNDNFSVSWNNFTEEEYGNSVRNILFRSLRKRLINTKEECVVGVSVRADGCVTDIDMRQCSDIVFESNKVEEWIVFTSPFLPPPNEEKYIREPYKFKIRFSGKCDESKCEENSKTK